MIVFFASPFEWFDEDDNFLIREVLLVEHLRFKIGSPKRGNVWTKIGYILNAIEDPKLRGKQRKVGDKWYNLLENTFKKKIVDEEKVSGLNQLELTDIKKVVFKIFLENLGRYKTKIPTVLLNVKRKRYDRKI